MTQQRRLGFDDPDSLTRDAGLSVVRASSQRVEPFDMSMFAGFTSMRALTYTASMRMIVGLLRDHEYDDFECIFGHSGVLKPDLSDVLAFQGVVEANLSKAFVAVKTSDDRRQALFDLVAGERARFFVVKDKIAHAKIYLLERDRLRRVIVGSANLSETAFSGRQAETLIMFDNDETAWKHYTAQYEAVRSTAASRLTPRSKPIPAEQIPVEEIATLREVEEKQEDVRIYVPAEGEEEAEVSLPRMLETVVKVAGPLRRALAEVRPDRNGHVSITPKIVKESITISRSRAGEDEQPNVYLSYDGREFVLSGEVMRLEAKPEEVRDDAARWIEFFGNESGVTVFRGPRRTIVFNDAHAPGRQANDVGHELSHGLLLHTPAAPVDGRGCRVWDREAEDEANWLSGALIVPEEAALHIVRRGWSTREAAARYGVTPKMIQYRLSVTAARKRVRRMQK